MGMGMSIIALVNPHGVIRAARLQRPSERLGSTRVISGDVQGRAWQRDKLNIEKCA